MVMLQEVVREILSDSYHLTNEIDFESHFQKFRTVILSTCSVFLKIILVVHIKYEREIANLWQNSE